jgi:uncharacterized membrane protein
MTKRLLAAIAVVVAVMSALAFVRWSVWSYGADTGTFSQSILNAFSGFANSVEPSGTHLRTHWSPVLAVLWPLVALTRSPLSIQFAQVVLIALAAVPLYAIVARYAGDEWALRCSALALIYPPLLANAFSEFHELAFYPVTVLALVWAADRARWGWFAFFAVVAVTIREDACATLIVFGLALAAMALKSRSAAPRGLLFGEPLDVRASAVAGLGLATLSVSALAAYAFLVLPHYGPWAPLHFYAYVLHPASHSLPQGGLAGRVTYLLEALVPLAFLPLFSRWTLLAVPAFAGILFADDPVVWRMGSHYVLLTVPWLLLAAAATLVRDRSIRWWRAASLLCVVFLIAFNPMHPLHYLRAEPYQQSTSVQRAMECVPRDARIATHDEWLAHLALLYPRITQFGKTPDRFDGYIVFATDWRNAHFEREVLPKIRAAQAEGRYQILCSYGNVRVVERADHSVSRMKRSPVRPASSRAASPIWRAKSATSAQ